MYTPLFNSVLVEINDEDAEWGSGNDDSMLGPSYSKGKVVSIGDIWKKSDYPLSDEAYDTLVVQLVKLKGKHIMWNQGVEAGTTWDEDGKKYGFIYWWDVRGVKVDDK